MTTDEKAIAVHPDDIKAECLADWLNFDAEDYCHNCGTRNVKCWFAPNGEWNEMRDQLRALSSAEILCPQCYTEVYERGHPGEYVAWQISRDRSHEVDHDLSTSILHVLSNNPHASPEFLAERIAMLIQ